MRQLLASFYGIFSLTTWLTLYNNVIGYVQRKSDEVEIPTIRISGNDTVHIGLSLCRLLYMTNPTAHGYLH